jgi:hypothetical protein
MELVTIKEDDLAIEALPKVNRDNTKITAGISNVVITRIADNKCKVVFNQFEEPDNPITYIVDKVFMFTYTTYVPQDGSPATNVKALFQQGYISDGNFYMLQYPMLVHEDKCGTLGHSLYIAKLFWNEAKDFELKLAFGEEITFYDI